MIERWINIKNRCTLVDREITKSNINVFIPDGIDVEVRVTPLGDCQGVRDGAKIPPPLRGDQWARGTSVQGSHLKK